jgi:hypothetical protein
MMRRNSRVTIDLRLHAARPLRKAVRQEAEVFLFADDFKTVLVL